MSVISEGTSRTYWGRRRGVAGAPEWVLRLAVLQEDRGLPRGDPEVAAVYAERDAEIRAAREVGETLRSIAFRFDLSPERVRQIALAR